MSYSILAVAALILGSPPFEGSLYEAAHAARNPFVSLASPPHAAYREYQALALEGVGNSNKTCNSRSVRNDVPLIFNRAVLAVLEDDWSEYEVCIGRAVAAVSVPKSASFLHRNLVAHREMASAFRELKKTELGFSFDACPTSWLRHTEQPFVGVRDPAGSCHLFVVDSGAHLTYIGTEFLRGLQDQEPGDQPHFVSLADIRGVHSLRFTNVPTGVFTAPETEALKRVGETTDKGRYSASGVLGQQLLKQVLVIWDKDLRQLKIVPRFKGYSVEGLAPISLGSDGTKLVVEVKSAGPAPIHMFSCLFDTGSEASGFPKTVADRLFGDVIHSGPGDAVKINKVEGARTYDAILVPQAEIFLGGVPVTLKNFVVKDDANDLECLIGWSDISATSFVLDVGGRRFYHETSDM